MQVTQREGERERRKYFQTLSSQDVGWEMCSSQAAVTSSEEKDLNRKHLTFYRDKLGAHQLQSVLKYPGNRVEGGTGSGDTIYFERRL